MTRKKDRVPVVIDTNVFVANYLSTNRNSPNVGTVRLWRERRLQLIISEEITDEYGGILTELNIPENFVTNFLIPLQESGAELQ